MGPPTFGARRKAHEAVDIQQDSNPQKKRKANTTTATQANKSLTNNPSAPVAPSRVSVVSEALRDALMDDTEITESVNFAQVRALHLQTATNLQSLTGDFVFRSR